MIKIILIVLSTLPITSLIAERNYDISFEKECNLLADLSEEGRALDTAISSLDWKTDERHTLVHSNSSISIPKGYSILLGEETQKFTKLIKEPDSKQLEAIITSCFNNFIYFSYHPEGYIPLDSWEELDSNDLLAKIKANTEKDNVERKSLGVIPLQVIGWLQPPKLDRNTYTLTWSIEIKEEANFLVNSVALKLCRNGFETIVWLTDKDAFVTSNEFELMLESHQFNPGFRYEDFISGDLIAKYGIASLVAALSGELTFEEYKFLHNLGILIVIVIACCFRMLKFGENKTENRQKILLG